MTTRVSMVQQTTPTKAHVDRTECAWSVIKYERGGEEGKEKNEIKLKSEHVWKIGEIEG